MTTPVFLVPRAGAFCGMLNEPDPSENELAQQLAGPTTVEPNIERLWVHGTLESRCGFDIGHLVAGDVKAWPVQDAVVVSMSGDHYSAYLLFCDFSGTAVLVDHTEAGLKDGLEYLLDGPAETIHVKYRTRK